MSIVLVEAAEVEVGDLIIPEEFDPVLQPEDYDEACAVPVQGVRSERGWLHIAVEQEEWQGWPDQYVLKMVR